MKGGMLTISHATVSTPKHTFTINTNTLTPKSNCTDQKENIVWGCCVRLPQSGGWQSGIDIDGLSWQPLLFLSPLPPRPAAPW